LQEAEREKLAAIKLQAVTRGHIDRKHVKEKQVCGICKPANFPKATHIQLWKSSEPRQGVAGQIFFQKANPNKKL
jgi:hypothetical protein